MLKVGGILKVTDKMQFDEDNLENQNNDLSLDDDGGEISWQDLLSTDEDDSAIIKEETDNAQSELGEFNLDALKDDPEINEPQSFPEENDMPVLENEENINYDNEAQTPQNEPDTADFNDDLLINTNQSLEEEIMTKPIDNINIESTDLSGIVDDELLSLLDENEETKETSSAPEEAEAIATFNSDGDVYLNDAKDNTEDNVELSYYEQNTPDENDESEPSIQQGETYVEKDYPDTKPKKTKMPLILAALVLVFLLISSFFLIQYFKGDSVVQNGDADEIIADLPNDFDTNERTLSNNKINAENMQAAKEAQELLDKVGSNKSNKELDDKIIVNVQTGGRSNPFVPSSLFNDKGGLMMGGSIPMPPEGVIDSPEAQEARKLLTISVSGIMFDPSKPSAILRFDGRDYFVQRGDRIDTYTVNQITRDYVAIRNAANIYKAYVGESFQLSDPVIPASNQMKYRGNTRQYISSDDIQISTK